jgi:hypothetical protein
LVSLAGLSRLGVYFDFYPENNKKIFEHKNDLSRLHSRVRKKLEEGKIDRLRIHCIGQLTDCCGAKSRGRKMTDSRDYY